ncbi:MAG: hypothetical protein AB1758_38425, partial [Candidatus Eremiobacterota bacterium]
YRNANQLGVAQVVDRSLPGQVMDVAYYSGDSVEYCGSVQMKNAFLFCEKDVVIYGGMRGVGAIVALGDVTLHGDSVLDATDRLCIMAGGKITIRGSGNYFTGILYAQGGIDARNLTVAGNVIANNPTQPELAGALLDQVTIVSTEEAPVLNFTVQTFERSDVVHTGGGQLPFVVGGGGFPGADGRTHDQFLPPHSRTPEMISATLNATFDQLWSPGAQSPGAALSMPFNSGLLVSNGADGVLNAFTAVYSSAQSASAMQGELDEIDDQISQLEANRPSNPRDLREWERKLRALNAARRAAEESLAAEAANFQALREAAIQAYNEYVATHTNANGSYDEGDVFDLGHSIPISIDINQFLPPADLHRITTWHLTPRRLY